MLEIVVAITAGILVPIIIGFATWLRKQRECTVNTDARTLRQSKALIVLANRMDDINFEQHGKKLNLGPEIETILKDAKGDL